MESSLTGRGNARPARTFQVADALGRLGSHCVSQSYDCVGPNKTPCPHGGLLAEILDRLAGFLEASARLRKKVKSAMTYPVIVLCIAFAITTFLIVRVVPVFGEIFADFGAKLPAPTQFLIDVSDFVRGQWYFLILGIGGAIFGVRTFLRSTRGKQLWDRWKLKLPVFGPLVHKICMLLMNALIVS